MKVHDRAVERFEAYENLGLDQVLTDLRENRLKAGALADLVKIKPGSENKNKLRKETFHGYPKDSEGE